MARKEIGAAAVILDEAKRVLLVRHAYGHRAWELPGGHAENGESLDETARREVCEETGLAIKTLRLTGLYYDLGTDYHQAVFLCQRENEAVAPRADGEEIAECAFKETDDLPRAISDYTIRRIRDALSGSVADHVTPVSSPKYPQ